jgi:hypothetical protein
MFFIYTPRLVSQAGRHGFDSHLPLHLFNHLGEFSNFFHSISLVKQGAQYCQLLYRSARLVRTAFVQDINRHADAMPALVRTTFGSTPASIDVAGMCPT